MLVNALHVSSYPRGGCTMNVSGVSEVTVRGKGGQPRSAVFLAGHIGYVDVGGLESDREKFLLD